MRALHTAKKSQTKGSFHTAGCGTNDTEPVNPKQPIQPNPISVKINFRTEKALISYIGKYKYMILRLRLDKSTALYIYKDKNCKLLVLFTQAQKNKIYI